jgi:hypothetical protein
MSSNKRNAGIAVLGAAAADYMVGLDSIVGSLLGGI